jgi:hypothetical protein
MDRRSNSFALLGATVACLWASSAAVRAQGTSLILHPNGNDVRISLFLPPDLNVSLQDALSVMHRQGNNDNSLMMFDLSSIPPGVSITDATLTLWVDQNLDPGGDFGLATKVFRITKAWVNWQVTWAHASGIRPSDYSLWTQQGGDFVGINGGLIPYTTNTLGIPDNAPENPPQVYRLDLNVTSLVSEWYKATYPNYGLMLTGEEGNGVHFHSDRGADPSLYPALTVSYQ